MEPGLTHNVGELHGVAKMEESPYQALVKIRRWRPFLVASLIIVAFTVLLNGCASRSHAPPAVDADDAVQHFVVPRRSYPLTPAQEVVRNQATTAVEADIDAYLGRYLENETTERDDAGRIMRAGTRDLVEAMARGPLVISADDMRELFPQYAMSPATRSTHSISVHEAVTAMAQELYVRALAIDDPRGNDTVLFTAGGVASGKTTATLTIDVVQRAAWTAQIVYDSTMRRYESAQRRVRQALHAGKMVNVVYVFTPIERSAVWLVDRAAKSGRVVPADAAARSHWQSQHTFLKLNQEFGSDSSVSFILIDNSGEKPVLAAPEALEESLYSEDARFEDLESFIAYTRALVRDKIERVRPDGRLLRETEDAFGI